MSKDWVGNKTSTYKTLGASSHAKHDRQEDDFYATDPNAIKLLLELETFNKNIWECSCGQGHLSKVLEAHGYDVISTDLVDRGYGITPIDFLKETELFDGDIITNPPYKFAKEFIYHSLSIIPNGRKVVMFLKVQFLEGKERKKLFESYPPKIIYISSSRIECAMNGLFTKESAVAYAWYIWEKGYTGETVIKWFN